MSEMKCGSAGSQLTHFAEGVRVAVRMILDVNLPRRLEVGARFRGVTSPEALQRGKPMLFMAHFFTC